MSRTARPERWALRVDDAPDALLVIPPDAARERCFDIACALTVRCGDDLSGAWHGLAVHFNGTVQWQRRIASSNPGSRDGLDVHLRATVPVGEALKVLARAEARGVVVARLEIEADELDPG